MKDVTAVDADTNPFYVIVNDQGRLIKKSLAEQHAYLLNISMAEANQLPPEFWVLQGYALAVEAIMPKLRPVIQSQVSKVGAFILVFIRITYVMCSQGELQLLGISMEYQAHSSVT